MFNPLNPNPTNCLSVFDHFAGLALKGLRKKHTVSKNIFLKKLSLSKV